MTTLSMFTDEEQELIISLPYRSGLWVSYADDEDGEDDDEKEMAALESAIGEIAKLHEEDAFLQELMSATLGAKDKWPGWSQGVFQTPEMARKVVGLLVQKMSTAEVKTFSASIMEIATAVAQAYGEFGEEGEPDSGFFGQVMGKIAGGFSSLSPDDAGHPMNVSAAENSALSKLADGLKVPDA